MGRISNIKKGKLCKGCKNDVYNGHTKFCIPDCWYFKKSKVVQKKEVHVDQPPPWNQPAKRLLSCYNRPRYIYVDANKTNITLAELFGEG